MPATLHYVCTLGSNDIEKAQFESNLTNSSNAPVVEYYNITVIDKQNIERTALSDIYNVMYKSEDGSVNKIDDMGIYYNVDIGHTYNASYQKGSVGYYLSEIVGEV